jgi:large subunit ribosomal protein L3
MPFGLIGKKQGMTQVFTEEGASVPVTVIKIDPNYITQIKTDENDGYQGIQVATGQRKANRVTKPMAGHFSKANIQPAHIMGEFRIHAEDRKNGLDWDSFQVGSEVPLDIFKDGQYVDVAGTTKGRGFTGVITRWNFKSQRASHGNSLSHNAPGSIGQNQSPGRVFKGKKMAGHYGNTRVTTKNLEIVSVDKDNQLLLVKGAVAGSAGGYVWVYPASKKSRELPKEGDK